jgi:hypothetical protein
VKKVVGPAESVQPAYRGGQPSFGPLNRAQTGESTERFGAFNVSEAERHVQRAKRTIPGENVVSFVVKAR